MCTREHAGMSACMHACVCVGACVFMYMWISMYVHVCVNVYMYMYGYIYMHIYMYVYGWAVSQVYMRKHLWFRCYGVSGACLCTTLRCSIVIHYEVMRWNTLQYHITSSALRVCMSAVYMQYTLQIPRTNSERHSSFSSLCNTHCTTPQHVALHCNTLHRNRCTPAFTFLRNVNPLCHTLHHTATRRIPLQHTAPQQVYNGIHLPPYCQHFTCHHTECNGTHLSP